MPSGTLTPLSAFPQQEDFIMDALTVPLSPHKLCEGALSFLSPSSEPAGQRKVGTLHRFTSHSYPTSWAVPQQSHPRATHLLLLLLTAFPAPLQQHDMHLTFLRLHFCTQGSGQQQSKGPQLC